MKILTNFASKKKKIGGISKHIDALTQAISGNDNFELIGIVSDAELGETKKEKVTDNCYVIKQPLEGLNIKAAFNARTLAGFEGKVKNQIDFIKKLIEEEKPDLIMINGTYWYPWILLKAAMSFDIPIIHYYAGSLRRETLEYPKTTRAMFLEMERAFSEENVLEHFFPSELALKSVEKEVFGYELTNARVIHNGINIRYQLDRNPVPFSVGLIGRWTSVKNFDFVFDLAEINKENENKLIINMVTDITEDNAKYRKLNNCCVLHEPMDFEYLVNFYNGIGVIICPSHFETFGNVALEALSHGVPVLISKNMGVAEVFRKFGLEDWIVDFSDTKAVFDKIISLQGVIVPAEIIYGIKKDYSFENVYQTYLNIFGSYNKSL